MQRGVYLSMEAISTVETDGRLRAVILMTYMILTNCPAILHDCTTTLDGLFLWQKSLLYYGMDGTLLELMGPHFLSKLIVRRCEDLKIISVICCLISLPTLT